MEYIKINPADNVAVAIRDLNSGNRVIIDNTEITLVDNIPAGHKFLLKDCDKGENIIKYGYPIGHLLMPRHKGELVNDKHIKTNLEGLLDYTYNPVDTTLTIKNEELAFNAYHLKNGEIGIRNEIWIIPTVGCVNGVANQLAERLKRETDFASGKNYGVERIVAFPHNYGCSQLSDDHENTRKILRDMVLHPNAGAVLIVGLGCENNQPDKFEEL